MKNLTLFRDIDQLLSFSGAFKKQGRRIQEADLSVVEKAALLCGDGKILWSGPQKKLSKKLIESLLVQQCALSVSYAQKTAKKLKEISLQAKTVLPGLIECHTHLGFAGSRASEFEMRLQGVSYQEIYEKGGGIQSTVKATRGITRSELFTQTQRRANHFLHQGVTTLEAKSGYGLDLKTEIKLLQAYQKIQGPQIISTYLGLHAKPPEFPNADEYLDFVIRKVLPEINKKQLASRVDIFVEKGYFSQDQSKRYFDAAKKLGFQCVIHADQLSICGGADAAIGSNCLSADHLLQITEKEIQNLAKSEVTCVLLPAADLYMKSKYPPARALIDEGARVALATDFNPGSSPTQNLNLVGVLARLEMKMSLPEVLGAYIVGSSFALGLQNQKGCLVPGFDADFLCSDLSWHDMFYSVGSRDFQQIYRSGREIHSFKS